MAVKQKQSSAQIAEEKMPGWKAVDPVGPVRTFGVSAEKSLADSFSEVKSQSVDAVMPSIEKLRRKYLGADSQDIIEPSTPMEPDVDIVDMKSGDLEKTVGVNRRTGKIEWSQG